MNNLLTSFSTLYQRDYYVTQIYVLYKKSDTNITNHKFNLLKNKIFTEGI